MSIGTSDFENCIEPSFIGEASLPSFGSLIIERIFDATIFPFAKFGEFINALHKTNAPKNHALIANN